MIGMNALLLFEIVSVEKIKLSIKALLSMPIFVGGPSVVVKILSKFEINMCQNFLLLLFVFLGLVFCHDSDYSYLHASSCSNNLNFLSFYKQAVLVWLGFLVSK